MSVKKGDFGRTIIGVFPVVLLLGVSAAIADIKLPAIIGDNMVLQQGGKVAIWGWADAGEEVIVSTSWHSMQWGVKADGDGKWKFEMTAPKTGGPYEMTLKGKNAVTIENIMSGEVWVCSSQSNMEWPVAASNNAQQEIAAAKYSKIRLFTVQKKIADSPQADCTGSWQPCSPQTISGFSAVGYFFGRHLHKELDVPVGLINTSWGGTVAEAWTRAGALEKMPVFKARLEEIEKAKADPEASQKKYQEKLQAWQQKMNQAADKGKECIGADFDDSAWKEMNLPGLWDNTELGGFDGIVWFRKTIELPASAAGKGAVLTLGPIDDMDTTWLNGVQVGGLQGPGKWTTPREYKIAANVIKAGKNIIVVRVLDTGGGGGFSGTVEQMALEPADGDAISLAGKWRYKAGDDMKSMPPQPKAPAWMNNPNMPTALYNGMIAPLIPYGIQGAIWYQGESNVGRAYQYRELFPLMITNWRTDWGRGDFPFIFVQLANFMAVKEQPGESAWAELQEAQL
ncbi:MAG: sialate O-acetylesterase, partial [Planctomycetota bacterium]